MTTKYFIIKMKIIYKYKIQLFIFHFKRTNIYLKVSLSFFILLSKIITSSLISLTTDIRLLTAKTTKLSYHNL